MRKILIGSAAVLALGAPASGQPPISPEVETPVNYGNAMHMCDSTAQNTASNDGREYDGLGGGIYYSQQEDADIAIVIFTANERNAGQYVQGGNWLAEQLNEQGYATKCFTADHGIISGSGYVFLVNGQEIFGNKALSFVEARADVTEENGQPSQVKTEARLVRESGIKGDCRYILNADCSND